MYRGQIQSGGNETPVRRAPPVVGGNRSLYKVPQNSPPVSFRLPGFLQRSFDIGSFVSACLCCAHRLLSGNIPFRSLPRDFSLRGCVPQIICRVENFSESSWLGSIQRIAVSRRLDWITWLCVCVLGGTVRILQVVAAVSALCPRLSLCRLRLRIRRRSRREMALRLPRTATTRALLHEACVNLLSG